MKILFINRGLGTLYGGGESFDYNAAKYLQRLGHNLQILTAKPFYTQSKIKHESINVTFITVPFLFRKIAYKLSKKFTRISAFFFKFDELLFGYAALNWLRKHRHEQFDLIQILSLTWLAKHIIYKFNIPCVSWLPGIPGKIQQKHIRAMINQKHFSLFSHGAPVLFLKNDMHIYNFVEVSPGIELDKIDKIKNYFDKKDFRNKIGIDENDIVGITVARLIPIKNIIFLIKALQLVVQSHPEYKHLIVGDGPMRSELKDIVAHSNLKKKIIFIGFVPNQDVYKFLQSADLFVLTSTYESFSIALLEAMANSLPVIVTDVGYMGTLVRQSNGGKIIESNNIKQLYEAIKLMVEDKNKRIEFGKNGRRYVEQFDWPIIAKKLEALYYKTVNE